MITVYLSGLQRLEKAFFLFGLFCFVIGEDIVASGDASTEIDRIFSTDSDSIFTLNKIVVSAEKNRRLLESSQSLTIIRRNEWEGTNKSIADIIAEQTGVQTRRYGGTGSFQTVSIRGVQGNEVTVLLDGIPLNSAMGGAVDLGAINPDRIEEIEVYKGIIPAELGGNALGGVINLKSRSYANEGKININGSIGSYGYKKSSVESFTNITDKILLFGSVLFSESGNNWPYLDRNKTPKNSEDDTIRAVENHQYDFVEARFHSSADLSGGNTLSSGISYSSSRTGIPGIEGSVNKTAFHAQEIITATFCLTKDPINGPVSVGFSPEIGYLRWSGTTFWTGLDECMGTSHGSITSRPYSWGEIKSVLNTIHAVCKAKIGFGENTETRLCLKGRHSEISTETKATGFNHGDWPGNSQEAALGADIIGYLPFEKIRIGFIAGGVRQIIRNATEGGRNDLLETKVDKSDTIEFPWSLRCGIHCRTGDIFGFFLNAGRYSRSPSLRERYGGNGALLPNPDLTTENGITLESGGRLFINKHRFETTLFRTETRNCVVMLSDGNMTKPVNLAAGLTQGIEMSLNLSPYGWLNTELRATLQKAENRSRFNNYYGRRLPNEPDLSILGKIYISPFRKTGAEYWCDFKSAFFRDFANTAGQRVPESLDKPGLLFHNIKFTWRPVKEFIMSACIRNINSNVLRYEEMTRSVEGGYSWILYPVNEWCFTAGYSF